MNAENKLKLVISNLKNLPHAAGDILSVAGTARLIAFSGPLGSGKTTIIKALCRRLGAGDTVSSPSFTIVNEYMTTEGEPIYHLDLYRIKTVAEAYDFGVEEYLYSGCWCFVEWPEIIDELLPDETVRIKISTGESGERIVEFQ